VLTVQRLLNGVPPGEGQPTPLLAEDGWIGPKTVGAINRFQKKQFGWQDGRVDPKGPTLRRLNALRPALTSPLQPILDFLTSLRHRVRLFRVHRTMPDLKLAARTGLRKVEEAMTHLTLGSGALQSNAEAYRLADLHFAFGKQASSKTLEELGFIRTTFNRVRTVLDGRPSVFGGNPFGEAIFEIDRDGKEKLGWMAYSPMETSEHTGHANAGHIYLCDRLDWTLPDLFTHILMHELFHFVDDESQERQIVDHGYRAEAMKLPHAKRMHNADNYALFAFHVTFGKDRLAASQPDVAPFLQ
jgi:hypothetical protein